MVARLCLLLYPVGWAAELAAIYTAHGVVTGPTAAAFTVGISIPLRFGCAVSLPRLPSAGPAALCSKRLCPCCSRHNCRCDSFLLLSSRTLRPAIGSDCRPNTQAGVAAGAGGGATVHDGGERAVPLPPIRLPAGGAEALSLHAEASGAGAAGQEACQEERGLRLKAVGVVVGWSPWGSEGTFGGGIMIHINFIAITLHGRSLDTPTAAQPCQSPASRAARTAPARDGLPRRARPPPTPPTGRSRTARPASPPRCASP